MEYPDKNNPFFTEEDNNTGFGKSSYGTGSSGCRDDGPSVGWSVDEPTDEEFLRPRNQAEEIHQQKQISIHRQQQSTQRALQSIYDSESMGIATAEELVHQGEQLKNVDRKLDDINQDLKTSQKHINNIKSVFGGFKNWWSGSGKKDGDQTRAGDTADALPSPLQMSMESSKEASSNAGMRIRGQDVSGFYEGSDDTWKGAGGAHSQYSSSSAQKQNPTSGATGGVGYDPVLDKNLDEMSLGMARLKGLATGLGDEIESQDELLDKVATKTDRANIKLPEQNRQMNRILGK